MVEETQELKERKIIIALEADLHAKRHSLKMQELEFERESMKLNHEWVLERGRIQRAEERKMMSERRSMRG